MKQFAATAIRLVAGLALIASARAQGTFQNLGFESAVLVRLPGDPYSRVQFAAAFPGWAGYVAGVPLDAALYNAEFLDSSGISIVDRTFPVIQGNYTAILQAGNGLATFEPADVTLSQTGLVPSGTRYLLFEARFSYGRPPTSFAVTLGGQNLSLVPLSTSLGNTLYSADITQWAGQMARLDFTLFAGRPHIDNAFLTLDSIQFSPVPEPSAFGVLAMGVGVLGCRALANSRRRVLSCKKSGRKLTHVAHDTCP